MLSSLFTLSGWIIDGSYREEYGQYPQFWESLGKVWEKLSRSNLEDQQERDSIQAMAAFLISLTTQNGANQMQAM